MFSEFHHKSVCPHTDGARRSHHPEAQSLKLDLRPCEQMTHLLHCSYTMTQINQRNFCSSWFTHRSFVSRSKSNFLFSAPTCRNKHSFIKIKMESGWREFQELLVVQTLTGRSGSSVKSWRGSKVSNVCSISILLTDRSSPWHHVVTMTSVKKSTTSCWRTGSVRTRLTSVGLPGVQLLVCSTRGVKSQRWLEM